MAKASLSIKQNYLQRNLIIPSAGPIVAKIFDLSKSEKCSILVGVMKKRRVVILGSTGSIGTSALKVARDIPEHKAARDARKAK